MSHHWLKPFSAGVAITTIAWLGNWIFVSSQRSQSLFVVQAIKAIGMHRNPPPVDPIPNFETASNYLLAIAKHCEVRNWKIETNGMRMDDDDVARLKIDPKNLSNRSFNCLAREAKAPFITFERKSI